MILFVNGEAGDLFSRNHAHDGNMAPMTTCHVMVHDSKRLTIGRPGKSLERVRKIASRMLRDSDGSNEVARQEREHPDIPVAARLNLAGIDSLIGRVGHLSKWDISIRRTHRGRPFDEASSLLEHEQRVKRVDMVVVVQVTVRQADQRRDDPSGVLKDKGDINAVGRAVAVHVSGKWEARLRMFIHPHS